MLLLHRTLFLLITAQALQLGWMAVQLNGLGTFSPSFPHQIVMPSDRAVQL